MDWLGKMIGLPNKFLHSNKETHGGGVIQVVYIYPIFYLYTAHTSLYCHPRFNAKICPEQKRYIEGALFYTVPGT